MWRIMGITKNDMMNWQSITTFLDDAIQCVAQQVEVEAQTCVIEHIVDFGLLISEISAAVTSYNVLRVDIDRYVFDNNSIPYIIVDYDPGYPLCSYSTIHINLLIEFQELMNEVIPEVYSSDIEDKLDLIYSILRDNVIDKIINCIDKSGG